MKPNLELIKLVDKCLAQTISRVEMARLEEYLSDDEALQYYLEMVGIEADLPRALEEAGEEVVETESSSRSSFFTLRSLKLAAAAVVIFSVGVFSGKPFFSQSNTMNPSSSALNHTESRDLSSASITSMIGVTWAGDAPDSIQLSNQSAPVALKSGLIELTFASGVRSLVEGPATIKVTGRNAAVLEHGRLVADVPKGAEGFTVNYSTGKVVDLGTEFAIHVPRDQKGAEIGVFRGEVEVYDHQNNDPLKIIENHAVTQTPEAPQSFTSIPFKRDEFIRELPSREFSWSFPEDRASAPYVMEFDVSHLIWETGDYHAVVKWMNGFHALEILKADLLFDGQVVSSDHHTGVTGKIQRCRGNTYTFSVSNNHGWRDQKGKWTLRLTTRVLVGNDTQATVSSSGVVLFENSHSLSKQEGAFLGTWEYRHNGKIFRRTFTPDHRVQLTIDGKTTGLFADASWKVENGILILSNPVKGNRESSVVQERHLCRNGEKLIFINRPYRNAQKVE